MQSHSRAPLQLVTVLRFATGAEESSAIDWQTLSALPRWSYSLCGALAKQGSRLWLMTIMPFFMRFTTQTFSMLCGYVPKFGHIFTLTLTQISTQACTLTVAIPEVDNTDSPPDCTVCTQAWATASNAFIYCLAYEMSIALLGVILKACSPVIATLACISLSNSTNDMPGRASTMRTSLKPGNCWNSMLSIWLLVAVGRFCTNNILFGGSTPVATCTPHVCHVCIPQWHQGSQPASAC
jgi:hypothetical protein